MGLVNDAFVRLKSNLEITATEQSQASSRHTAIRDHVRSSWSLSADFLTGSYVRDTKTKKLRDVDIFLVIDPEGDQAPLRKQAPSAVLEALRKVLATKWPDSQPDVFACVIPFGSEDEVMSFDAVPAFALADGSYEIPDSISGGWIRTNPKIHHDKTIAANKDCAGKWVPLVKMIKGANRQAGDPIEPSFLIEVMALSLVRGPMHSYQHEFAVFCARAAENAVLDWQDPAGLGPAVNRGISAFDRARIANVFRTWQAVAEEAIDLEADGSERAAVAEWKKLFGSRMPSP